MTRSPCRPDHGSALHPHTQDVHQNPQQPPATRARPCLATSQPGVLGSLRSREPSHQLDGTPGPDGLAAAPVVMPTGSPILRAMPPSTNREGPPARRPGAGAVAAVAVTLVLVVFAAAAGGGWSVGDRFGVWQRLGQRTLPPSPPRHVAPLDGSSFGWRWITVGLIAMLVVIAIVVIWRLPRLGRWHRGRFHQGSRGPAVIMVEGDLELARRTLPAALNRALCLVQQEGDPTDVIVAAWLALEEAAALIGSPRGAADTPTEFTAAVLAHTPADRIAVGQLLQLYHRARFSTAGAGADDLVSARRCLRDLAASWYRFDTAWSAENVDDRP